MHRTPILKMDLERVRSNYRAIMGIFGERLEIFYAVKANRDRRVLATLMEEGSGLDVASVTEVKLGMDAGCDPARMAFSNPIKAPWEIQVAYGLGVRMYGADSDEEIKKLAKYAPGSDVYVRIDVPNKGSVWPLSGKFGVEKHEAKHLLVEAKRVGLNPVGVTFHVGSQCLNPENWATAIDFSKEVFDACAAEGITLTLLNLGGGLPAMENMTNPPPVEDIGRGIMERIERLFDPSVRVLIEPGRHLVATAGTLTATVIGEAVRRGEHWLYLDLGVYNGLMEIHEKFPYELKTDHEDRERRAYVLAGPTCDSVDVIFNDITLPKLVIGDRIHFMNAGAYTTGYDRYNGFDFPHVEYGE